MKTKKFKKMLNADLQNIKNLIIFFFSFKVAFCKDSLFQIP